MKGSTMSVSCVEVIQLKIDIASVGFWRKRRGVARAATRIIGDT